MLAKWWVSLVGAQGWWYWRPSRNLQRESWHMCLETLGFNTKWSLILTASCCFCRQIVVDPEDPEYWIWESLQQSFKGLHDSRAEGYWSVTIKASYLWGFFGTGMMTDILKHAGTVFSANDQISMSVKVVDSWSAQCLRILDTTESGLAGSFLNI